MCGPLLIRYGRLKKPVAMHRKHGTRSTREINTLRDEAEERFSEIGHIHSEYEASRHDAGGPREGKE